MSRRNRVFIGIIVIFAAGLGFLLYTFASDLDIRYRESTEQVMVDSANVLASWLETDASASAPDIIAIRQAFKKVYQRRFDAPIYGSVKHNVDLRALVTDANGIVLFDSYGKETGKDFRAWHDIAYALSGRYGARTTRNDPADPSTTIMYVSVPIYSGNAIIGAVCVSKAVASHRELLLSAQHQLLKVGLLTLAGSLLLLITVSIWLTNPSRLSHDLIQVFKQEKLSQPARLLARMGNLFKNAFYNMRDAMAGRNFSEDYIQSLTHELKSPLTAIRGAAELLGEPMTDAQRERFTSNIALQVQRLQDLAERLLELTSVEKRRRLENPQTIDVTQLARDCLQGLEMRAKQKQVGIALATEAALFVQGEVFLLQRALINLVENALDFSPAGSTVKIGLSRLGKHCRIRIRDHGPGIPDYALARLFDKFYSLSRPDTGQKSTGLGLPFVREIAHLHGGKISLSNHPEGGAVALLSLPAARPPNK